MKSLTMFSRLPGRINSTWGGNLTDMVRSTHYLRIIEQEHLVENAREMGQTFLSELRQFASGDNLLSAIRGRGLMIAFDLPDREQRERFYHGLFQRGVIAIRGGERTIRFRPVLDVTRDVIDTALEVIQEQCREMRR